MKALTASGDPVTAASLAATCETLERVIRDDVPDVLRVRGAEIQAELETRLEAADAQAWFMVYGDPTWSLVAARPRAGLDAKALEDALSAALYARGVLSFGSHVPSMATREGTINRLLNAYEAVLPELMRRARAGAFDRRSRRNAA